MLGYIPEGGFILSADDATVLDGLDLAEASWLRPEHKLSPLLAEAAGTAYLVEFHPDVDPGEARALVRDLGIAVREHPDLLPSHLLVEATPDNAAALAEWDEVAYIYPASGDLLEGAHVEACPGALTEYGALAQYVARIGEGWDGPGKGAATLGYFLGPLAGTLSRDEVRAQILRALGEWSRVASISFRSAADPKAARTISILFGARSHGDPYPFDGRGRVLAHTFYPAPPNPEPIAGDMHFDADEPWGIGENIDLFSVALHEAGHALGLGHADRPGTVMYPYYRRVTALTADDVGAIRELYASEAAPAVPPAEPPKPPEPPQPPEPAPAIAITAPAPGYVARQASIQLTGTAGDGAVRVAWTNSRGGSGTAAGTRSWYAGPIRLESGVNLLTATAYSATGASSSRSVSVTLAAGSDTVPPAVSITSPAGTSVLTYDTSIVLRGTARDSGGVAQVAWADSTGAGGLAQGTTYWTTTAIPLREGSNTITVSARDAAGNTGWRAVVITRRKR